MKKKTQKIIQSVIGICLIAGGLAYFWTYKSYFREDIFYVSYGLVVIICLALMVVSMVRYSLSENSSHGTARWLSKKEEKKILNRDFDGVVVDGVRRISLKDSFEHSAVFAPSGKGKTASFIMPNIIRMGDYSSIIIDPSGEIFDTTASGLQKMGYNIMLLQPGSSKTMFYNPLYYMDTEKDCGLVSEALISKYRREGTDPFWPNAAGSLIKAVLMYLLAVSKKKDFRNIKNAKRFLSLSDEEKNQLIDAMEKENENIKLSYSGYRNASSNTKGGIHSVASEALELFVMDDVHNLTNKHNIYFSDLREKKSVLYIIIPEDEIEYYSPFISMFFGQLFKFLNKNVEGYPVFCFLEEFGNIGKIPNFQTVITTIRKRKVSINMVIQDPAQVEALYGKNNSKAILDGGCSSKIYLPGLSPDVCRRLSEQLGAETTEVENESVSVADSGGTRVSKNTTAFGRVLLTPDEIRTMDLKEAVFISGNYRPIKLKPKRHYEQKEFKGFLEYSKTNQVCFDDIPYVSSHELMFKKSD